MTKSRRHILDPRQLSSGISRAPQSSGRSAGSNCRFEFNKRSQLFIRTHNVTLAVINCDFGLALFGQQVDTNRPFQFHKRGQLFISAHNETISAAAICINNIDCLFLAVHRCNTAPTPSGCAKINCRASRSEAATDRKRLSFALGFVVSDSQRRRGGIGRRAGLKIQ